MKKKYRVIHRVDLQVSLLTAAVVMISVLAIYFFNYTISYKQMIATLEERSFSLYKHADNILAEGDFENLNTKADEDTDRYRNLHTSMLDMKQATDVLYFYTAKPDPATGEFIYIIDGLETDDEYFRHIGDPLEQEIVNDFAKAMTGEAVMPSEIMDTDWGYIFLSYFPVHNEEGDIVGVVGIEFNAEHEYATFRTMRVFTPILIVVMMAVSAITSVYFFRRISNPNFKDFANTDYLTGFKNRNAFEVEMDNMRTTALKNAAVLVMDVNALKAVNDEFGHQSGDEYIKTCANAATEVAEPYDSVVYRTGGDEFLAVFFEVTEQTLETIKTNITQAIAKAKADSNYPFDMSISLGCAMFDKSKDKSLHDTYVRADAVMYEDKRKHYATR